MSTTMTDARVDAEHYVTELFVEMHPRQVHIHKGLTPLQARNLNLATTCRALELAGISYFVTRSLEDRSSSVAVRIEDRSNVYTALGRLMEREKGYIQCMIPAGVGRNPVLPGNRRTTWGRLQTVSVIRLIWFRAEGEDSITYGREYGCDIEFWRDSESGLTSPRANRCTRVIRNPEPISVDPSSLTRMGAGAPPSGLEVRTLRDFAIKLPEDINFPIDAVYTWVDGTDPVWGAKRAAVQGTSYHAESASSARYLSRNELRYSFRSLHMFAPWIRNIFVVTDDQVPPWLDTSIDGVKVVSHREIFKDSEALPTYNSHAIESQLHHIDGLSEHFLYFNDDMFIGRPVTPNAFFLANGTTKYFPSQSRIPLGPITELDTPVDAACKNNRKLIEARFGATITQSMQHVPYALRRSVLQELEDLYPAEHATTAHSRFRSQTDHSITSSLHQYYAFHTSRAMSGTLRYTYIQLAVKDLAARLERLLARRDRDAFCLNDAFSTEEQLASQIDLLTPFFESYFPVPSPYEKRGDLG